MGSFGKLYLATDLKTGEEVAVKAETDLGKKTSPLRAEAEVRVHPQRFSELGPEARSACPRLATFRVLGRCQDRTVRFQRQEGRCNGVARGIVLQPVTDRGGSRSQVLIHLQGGPGIPSVYWVGKRELAGENCNILVMDLLGPDMEDLLEMMRVRKVAPAPPIPRPRPRLSTNQESPFALSRPAFFLSSRAASCDDPPLSPGRHFRRAPAAHHSVGCWQVSLKTGLMLTLQMLECLEHIHGQVPSAASHTALLLISQMSFPEPCKTPIPTTLDDFSGYIDFYYVYNQF